jgi:hypothetical protein
MQADGITKNVTQQATGELVNYLSDEDKFIRSKDEPKAGDIFLWRSNEKGHTGIVESVDADGTVHTIEAYGTKEGTIRYKRNLSDFTKRKGWQGFFRPVVETADGKIDGTSNESSNGSGGGQSNEGSAKKQEKASSPIKVTVNNGNNTTSATIDPNRINSFSDLMRELSRWFNW